YDNNGRVSGSQSFDMNGDPISALRVVIYAGNDGVATFGDTVNGLLQSGASDADINIALSDYDVVKAAGEQLGGVDNAINFVSNVI
ncbi:hypothetical protein, partial [Klebsiella pneumoniae]|uniref:hypothetical protein n=1 Tax=Klebsiella pneumoniae TaxID=573 RepID=UPI00272F788E